MNSQGNYTSGGHFPRSRIYSALWTDSKGDLKLFGGSLNLCDFWSFNGNWSWLPPFVSSFCTAGKYGTKRVGAANNYPGLRQDASYCTDSSNNLWLFGGYYFSLQVYAFLNDLWKWNGTYWTWMSGSNTYNSAGIYGIKGVGDFTNSPGSRSGATFWIDSKDSIWLFGGINISPYNDLWKFDQTNWTWIDGPSTTGDRGIYLRIGGYPPSRRNAQGWTDSKDQLWLFGGVGANGS